MALFIGGGGKRGGGKMGRKKRDFKDIRDLKTCLAFKESAKGPLSLAVEAEGLICFFKSILTR